MKIISFRLDDELFNELEKTSKTTGKNKSEIIKTALILELKMKKNKIKIHEGNERTYKTGIFLTKKERIDFLNYAKSLGYSSWQKLAVNLLRESVYNRPTLQPNLIGEIAQLNFQLSAVGKNLNQIARAINTSAKKMLTKNDINKINDVLELNVEISNYLEKANIIINNSINRN